MLVGDSMRIITFKCHEPIARKLKREPSINRRFNTKSEIIRTLCDLYLNDHIVKHAVDEGIRRKHGDAIEEGIL